jgi:hypothetical protein
MDGWSRPVYLFLSFLYFIRALQETDAQLTQSQEVATDT